MTIEVFKTNVTNESVATEVKVLLLRHFPSTRINFDLNDCDKVLRVEGAGFTPEKILLLVKSKGIVCSILD